MKVFLLGLVFFSYHTLAQDKEGFILVKKEGEILIHERWITFPNTTPPIEAREVKGEFIFNNSIHAAIRLLQDEEKIKLWQDHVSEFKVYKLTDTTTWIEYSYHDIPWPVSDQDHILQYKIGKISAEKIVITFSSIEDEKLAPKRKGVTRMDLKGSWTLEKTAANKVKATYRILSKPIGIPKFFTDPIIRSNIMTTIKGFITLLEP